MVDVDELLSRAATPRTLDLGAVARQARRRQARRRVATVAAAVVVVALAGAGLVRLTAGDDGGEVTVAGPAGSWTAAAQPPFEPRSGATAATLADGRVVVWGGRTAAGTPADGGVYDPETDRWQAVAPVPLDGVTYEWAVVAGGWLMVLGSGAPDQPVRGAVLALGGPLDRWVVIEPDSIVPAWPDGVAWDGSTLVVLQTRAEDGTGPVPRPRLARWSLADRAWRAGATPPLSSRIGPLVAFDGRLVAVWGGDAPNDADGDPVPVPRSDGAVYDVAADRWSALPPAPVEMPRPAGGWAGGELLVAGTAPDGRPTEGAAYDPKAGAWRRIPAAPLAAGQVEARPTTMPRTRPSASVGDVTLVAVGGGEAWWFDREAGTWRAAPGDDLLPFGPTLVATSRTRDNPGDGPFRAWVLGAGGAWQPVAEAPFANRMEAAVAVAGERLVVVGGEARPGLEPQGDAWVLDLAGATR